MAKKRKKKEPEKTIREQIEELVEYASSKVLPEDALHGDLRDAADEEADLIYENVCDSVLMEKLEFLVLHGWDVKRLRQIIDEEASEYAAERETSNG